MRGEQEIAQMRQQRDAEMAQEKKMQTMERLGKAAGQAAPAMDAITGAIDSSAMRNGAVPQNGGAPATPAAA
jgi:hypothetical protein